MQEHPIDLIMEQERACLTYSQGNGIITMLGVRDYKTKYWNKELYDWNNFFKCQVNFLFYVSECLIQFQKEKKVHLLRNSDPSTKKNKYNTLYNYNAMKRYTNV